MAVWGNRRIARTRSFRSRRDQHDEHIRIGGAAAHLLDHSAVTANDC
ncbi:hypothetical protein ACEQPO_16595 [Bacillus sp. SL00103]